MASISNTKVRNQKKINANEFYLTFVIYKTNPSDPFADSRWRYFLRFSIFHIESLFLITSCYIDIQRLQDYFVTLLCYIYTIQNEIKRSVNAGNQLYESAKTCVILCDIPSRFY